MRALAEYVMKGRTEAIIVSVLATGTVLFAWIGAAVIALVTLRKGASQSSPILLWAMLPAVVLAVIGDTGPATTLLGVMLASVVLRASASWSWALFAAVVSGVLTGLLGIREVEQVAKLLQETLTQVSSQSDEWKQLFAPLVAMSTGELKVFATGWFGLSNVFAVSLCLILARWWQAILYNPGGFRAEFHSLRMSPLVAIVLLAVGLLLSGLGVEYQLWALMFALPFMFAGIALVHGLVAKRQMSNNWLVVFYISWLILDPVKVLLVVIAIADSWLNIRERVASR